jgi:site-specific recombinase XerD
MLKLRKNTMSDTSSGDVTRTISNTLSTLLVGTSLSGTETISKDYRHYLERVGKSTHTVKAYLRDFAVFVHWFEQSRGEEFSAKGVDPGDVTEYRGYLLRHGSKPATINRRLVALSRFFKWAIRQKLVADSPFEALERVQVNTGQQREIAPRWLDENEQLALLRAVRRGGSARDLAVIQTLLGTGLRISELANLTISDLDISERKGWLRVREGKGNKSREIPLDNRTRLAISNYLEERKGSKVHEHADVGSDMLFLGQRGPINERGVDYLVRKYAYQARLQHCTAHTLRHTFAKNLVDTGTPLDQVATLLGHESLDTTRIYVRPSRQDLQRAVRSAAREI